MGQLTASRGHRVRFVVAGDLANDVVAASACNTLNRRLRVSACPTCSSSTGCATDWGDPGEELCITLPAGTRPRARAQRALQRGDGHHHAGDAGAGDGTHHAPGRLYSADITIDGPRDGVPVLVGFSSSSWKTYDDQLEATTHGSPR